MSQHAAREAAARAFDANPCKDTADALNGACYGTEDWWTPEGHPIRNGFRCCALWVAHVRKLDAPCTDTRVHLNFDWRPLCMPAPTRWVGTDNVAEITCPDCRAALGRAAGDDR